MKKEESLQIAVSNYLKLQYPEVIFTSEASGLKLTIGQAVKAKKMRSSSGLPDMIILEPNRFWGGLCLELKSKSPFKKNGQLKADKHLEEQEQLLRKLNIEKNFAACFVHGLDHAKKVIDGYMNERK